MKTTVFFDLGNVLLYFSHEQMLRQIAELMEIPVATITELVLFEGWGRRLERGEITTLDFMERLKQDSKKQFTLQALIHAATTIFQPNTALIPIVEALKQSGIRLFLLSNTNEVHFRYAYTHYPFLHLFDGYILSYEVGAVKPEEKIFYNALTVAGTSPESCFYVDDIPEYVDAARKIGLDAETFTTVETLCHQFSKRGIL